LNRILQRDRDVEAEPQRQKKGKVIKFGWLEGVFMRCLLNIWGVMLFLRLSWVVGQAGIGEGTAIICLANVVTLVTTISMSAVCTNGQIKGGGIYYMISRSLGPEFGGAIGLMFTLANSVAVSMYIVGFCESLQDLLRTSFDMTLIDGDTNDIRVVGLITLIGILVLAIVGMDWVTRTQMCLLFVLIASQVDFVVGSFLGPQDDDEVSKGFVGYNMETFKSNLRADYRYYEGVDHDFFSVFSVFFPAVTGIVAGANLSGDLKDPSSAIPIGTLLAIFVTFFSYVAYAFMMGGCVLRTASGNVTEYLQIKGETDEWSIFSNCTDRSCLYGLHNDSQAMELASSWGPLIYGGCFAATLSSAIASLVGAPRVLQALAKDKLYPLIGFFSKGHGANNDPVRGYVLVFLISFGCILIAQLNAIAPLLSNFFLAAYALINFSVFHASISKSPGWRPAFKYYNAWVSLIGTLLCIAVMFLMSWVMALITFVVVITLYLYVSYRKPEVNWGSSAQAHSYSSALKAMLELNRVEEHVKNFRPQVLVLTGMPGTRPPLVDFANLITKGLSLLVCGNILKNMGGVTVGGRRIKYIRFSDNMALLAKEEIILRDMLLELNDSCEQYGMKINANKTKTMVIGRKIKKGSHSQKVHDALTKKAYQWLIRHKTKAFFNITEDDSFEAGSQALMQISGLGKLRPNMILMGYKGNWRTCDREELKQYFNVIHNALDRYLAVGILRVQEGLDYSGIIHDEEFVPISSLDKKDAEEKMRRNQSTSQFPTQDVSATVLSDVVSSDTESPPTTPKAEHAAVNCDPAASETLLESGTESTSKKGRKLKKKINIPTYVGPNGEPLPKNILNNITRFQRKQPKGLIDVWWLYDDGGLTLLIPYIMSTRSQFAGSQLRVFSLASKGDDLDRDQRNLAGLLSKFRIDYSDVVIISDIHKKAMESTIKEFENFIQPFRVKDGDSSDASKASKQTYITESELLALKDKTNRHMRIRELLLQYSKESTFVVMALPIPRKEVVSAPLYMAWLELLTKGMPPYLIIRGNQTSVITFYS
ncbi:hypothetical protein ANN_03096, partial [Periplaneta americana]